MLGSYLLAALPGFVSGSVLYSYLLPKHLHKIDIVQNSDDHNPGTKRNQIRWAGLGMVCPLDWQRASFGLDCRRDLDSANRCCAGVAAPVCGHAFLHACRRAARPSPPPACCWGW
ncbi:MAG: hypothetical protein ACLSAP_08580 [Oscillospiraceae bacterium]